MNLLSEVGQGKNQEKMVPWKTKEEGMFYSTDASGRGSGKGMSS